METVKFTPNKLSTLQQTLSNMALDELCGTAFTTESDLEEISITYECSLPYVNRCYKEWTAKLKENLTANIGNVQV